MLRRFHPLLISLLAAAIALPLAAQQQQSTQQQASQPKKHDKTKKGTKEKTPQNPPAAPTSQNAQPPAAPAPQPKKGTAAEENPFPEAQSEKAAREAQQRQNAEPDNSSSSVVPGLNLPTKSSKQPTHITPALNPSLGRQDTKVGDFYRQSGDWKGAYDRFLEATQVDPGDAEAVYGLADSARHLGYRKLAIQNYQLYLSALPDGHHARDCRKALKEMGAKP